MQEQDSSSTPLPKSKPKKRLDMVVKLALGVVIASFTMIWGGMYLSRPDRTIPPYSGNARAA
jgi:LPS O-antigen subunit length determinant protein (WzzB/FepE family)